MSTLNNRVKRLACLFAVFAAALPIAAQWPAYPTRGIPRTADGKPDLNAPTPRTSDGKPDLSGVWDNGRNTGGERGARGTRGANPPPSADPPNATFFNVAAGFPDGLPLQPWAAELLRKRMADNSKDNPDAHCLPMGFMQFH